MHSLLLLIAITTNAGKPIPHARVQCVEITRMVDEEGKDEDSNGAVLVTDSRGHMVMTWPDDGETGELHCQAWAPGYRRWSGRLTVEGDERFTIVLQKGTDAETN